MKALMVIAFGLMIGTAGTFAHGDDIRDPNIVGRAPASRMLDYGVMFGASAGLQTLTAATFGVPSFD